MAKIFSLFDSWRSPSADLPHPWTGISVLFDSNCTDVDRCVTKICELHDISMTPSAGFLKRQHPFQRVRHHNWSHKVAFTNDRQKSMKLFPTQKFMVHILTSFYLGPAAGSVIPLEQILTQGNRRSLWPKGKRWRAGLCAQRLADRIAKAF